ncbi:MAG: hypothetical protein Q9159_000491 [Coniocarpon cinnabarinum]
MRVSEHVQSPWTYLFLLFLLWKTLLFMLAFLSPGIGYDTSTSLFYSRVGVDPQATWASRLQYPLIRWDALYFTAVARRDYFFEQDWAWGWGFTHSIRAFCQGNHFHATSLSLAGGKSTPLTEAHVSKLFSGSLCSTSLSLG